ncbi:hypothetical protein N7532_001683 [Penicillium argentinense]|uniref:Uncharacterized protein n=1 Tax=Penicillium argentinense TaxID=1131581 RepID=A0A9W9KMP2_9EURO|nr:uncharacterized protein N7532_001683 [Penicillium argentinense]KAJ5111148.1 hypothetical protein N7532_001683 [Penicillium argentinense]
MLAASGLPGTTQQPHSPVFPHLTNTMARLKSTLILFLLCLLVGAETTTTTTALVSFQSPVVGISPYFYHGQQELIKWGLCYALLDPILKNLGSIDIPCPENSEPNTCTIYEDLACTRELLTIDRSHSHLQGMWDSTSRTPVGLLAGSVKCDQRIFNRDTHIWTSKYGWTRRSYRCAGDSCRDDGDCETSLRNPSCYCSHMGICKIRGLESTSKSSISTISTISTTSATS